ncbi:MAG: DUF3391 domain-containing protein [Paucibacter sp.]|nr:DUF3391 domain-containing protein [Roseateles sp.]
MYQTTYIHPKALRIGLFVRLDMDWTSHPFSFNNFLLRDVDQVRQLQALGLERVLCDVKRSEPQALKTASVASAAPAAPAAASSAQAAGVPTAAPAELVDALKSKAQRLARLKTQMAQLDAAEKSFHAAVREMSLVTKNLFAQPIESLRRAREVVDALLRSMVNVEDVQLHLMNSRPNSRDVHDHELNTASLAMLLGRRLGLTEDALRDLGMACLMHDIGKREMPDSLTRKIGVLSTVERDALQQHVPKSMLVGREMVLDRPVLDAIAQHHEMADGSGYPRQLKLEGISRGGQILALANAFDNLCNPHHAMMGLTPHEALKMLFARERRRFAPDALAGFIKMMGIYPPGTLVELSDGSQGLVLSVGAQDALRPVILLRELGASRSEPVIVNLLEEKALSIRRGMQRSELSIEAATYLNPRRHVSYYASDVTGAG